MRFRLLALVPILLLGSLPALVPSASAAAPQSGPDVSEYQHDTGRAIDWAAVQRAGQSFTFIKATQGITRVDPWFATEWAGAARAGLVRGAYHYANPAQSADAQAAHVVAVVGSTRESNNLGIVLDLESTGGLNPTQLAAWAHTFLDGVERRTGRTPILYTYPYFWQTAMAGNSTFGAYPLWLASYSSRSPAALPGWTQWSFWQHTSSGSLPGIPGEVDRNVLCCSAGTLHALAEGRSGPITRLWRNLGGASGQLGLPRGPETVVPGGWGQSFQRGYVASTRSRGTYAVLGAIYARYAASKGPSGPLGVPVASARVVAAGVTEQLFAGGRIVHSAQTGAHSVTGPVLHRWAMDGGVRSLAGLPMAEPRGGGQQFRGGGLYFGPGGVHLVPGAMRDRYEELGGSSSSLGRPISEAQGLPNGRIARFELGQLVELEVAGQHVVV